MKKSRFPMYVKRDPGPGTGTSKPEEEDGEGTGTGTGTGTDDQPGEEKPGAESGE